MTWTHTDSNSPRPIVAMLNTHDPDLVDRFVAEDYRNHNPFVADGREANRQFWTAFFACDARSERHHGGPRDLR